MKLTVKAGGIPAGSHFAKFEGVEQSQSKHGEGLKWKFTVTSGQYAGVGVSGFTSDAPTTGNKCGRFVKGLTGKALTVGEAIDLNACVGKSYLIIVELTDKGGSKVVDVKLPPT